MILGRVVGEVWATRKHPGITGAKLLIVQPHFWYEPPFEVAHVVAIDTLGAGVGEDVIVCLGEPARQWLAQSQGARADAGKSGPGYAAAAWLPIEAAVMAIVDRVDIRGTDLPGRRPLRFIGEAPAWAPAAPAPTLDSSAASAVTESRPSS